MMASSRRKRRDKILGKSERRLYFHYASYCPGRGRIITKQLCLQPVLSWLPGTAKGLKAGLYSGQSVNTQCALLALGEHAYGWGQSRKPARGPSRAGLCTMILPALQYDNPFQYLLATLLLGYETDLRKARSRVQNVSAPTCHDFSPKSKPHLHL